MLGTKAFSESLLQHQLVILRRLRDGAKTEFELANEIAEHSGHSVEDASDNLICWLDELREAGLIWAGPMTNDTELVCMAAALTARGRELVT